MSYPSYTNGTIMGRSYHSNNSRRRHHHHNDQIQLHSKVSKLIDVLNLNQHNRLCHQMGAIHMSNPAFITQERPEVPDPDDSGTQALNAGVHLHNNINQTEHLADVNRIPEAINLASVWNEQQLHQQQQERNQNEELSAAASPASVVNTVSETLVVSLPNGRELNRQVPAQAVPYMMEHIILKHERIFGVFGIPLAVQLNANPSSQSSPTLGKHSSSSGAAHESKESTGNKVWNDVQRELLQSLVQAAQPILDYATYLPRYHRAQQINQKNKLFSNPKIKQQKVNPSQFRMKLVFPAIGLDANKAIELFKLGFMKFKPTVDIIASYYQMPIQKLFSTQQLTLKEMNGIEEPDDDPSHAGQVLSELARKSKKTTNSSSSSSSSSKPKKKKVKTS
jgi:hypothetical protein